MLAESLPDYLREAFAAFLLGLDTAAPQAQAQHNAIRKWARDAGHLGPTGSGGVPTRAQLLANPCIDPRCERRYENHLAHGGTR